MTLEKFLTRLVEEPETVEFADTIALIDKLYTFSETSFRNGDLVNAIGENSGSCKILAFAQMHNLAEKVTLACFGHYYRDEVLNDPDGTGHQNIRQFIRHGWSGIYLDGSPLTPR